MSLPINSKRFAQEDHVERLARTAKAAAESAALAATRRDQRREAIKLAHSQGVTMREIAQATGLSFQRVEQIINS
jgi:DNA-directed RNA polymerase specialized sigma24 family protein